MSVYSFWLFLSSILLSSCVSNPNNNTGKNDVDSLQRNNSITISNKDFIHMDSLVSTPFTITIVTNYIDDTLSEKEAWEAVQWPIVKDQKIIFKRNDSIRNTFNFSSKQVLKKTKSGQSVKSAEVIISNACLIHTELSTYFGIFEASGLCIGSHCPSYEGVFELNGTPVYQIFGDESEKKILLTGDKSYTYTSVDDSNKQLNKIYKSFGISNTILTEAWNNRKHIGIGQ